MVIPKNYYFIVRILIFLCIAILISSAFTYAIINHSEYIRADQWRFLELYIMPIYNQNFHINSLWSDHHPQPLTALLFIISTKYFHLDINLFSYIGIISKGLFLLLFLYFFKKTTISISKLSQLFLLLLLTSIFFSLKSINEYAWGLVTLSNFWFLFFLIILFFLNRLLKYQSYKNHFIFGLLLFILLLATRDFAIMAIAGIGLFILLAYFKNNFSNEYLFILVNVVISFLLYKMFYSYLDIRLTYSNSILLNLHDLNIIGFMNTLAVTLLSGFFNMKMMKEYGFQDLHFIFLGYLILMAYIYILFMYIKYNLFTVSSIPYVLILFTLIFLFAIFMFRFFPTTPAIDWRVMSPRYTKFYEVGAISLIWAYAVYFNKFKINNLLAYTLGIICTLCIILNFISISKSWNFSRYLVSSNKKVEKAFINCANNKESCSNLPKWAIGSSFNEKKLLFLKKNNLNVFYLKKKKGKN